MIYCFAKYLSLSNHVSKPSKNLNFYANNLAEIKLLTSLGIDCKL